MKSRDRKNVVFGKFLWKRSKLCAFYIISGHFVISNFFFSMVEWNTSAIYKSIILNFSVYLPLVFIYKFYEKEIQIQQPGTPREQHVGVVRQGTLKLKFNISNHRNLSANLSISFIYFYFVKKKLISNHQENLDNISTFQNFLRQWSKIS